MPKRASLPEGKALFFRPTDAPTAPPSDEATTPTEVDEFAASPQAVAPESMPSQAPSPTSELPVTKNTRQSAIFLEERHIDWLEDRCREARRNGGRAIRKAAVIRAVLDVAIEAGVDLTGMQREEELKPRIRRALLG